MVFGQKLKILSSAQNDTMLKTISREAEWHKFPAGSKRATTTWPKFQQKHTISCFRVRVNPENASTIDDGSNWEVVSLEVNAAADAYLGNPG